jgi:hypothetical protein
MKFVQDLTSKSVRYSGESTALGIGEANASPTQALREHAVLFLEIRDHLQLMAVDPPGEHHEQQLKRLKRWGHCSGVYGLINRRGSSSSRLAHRPIASFEFLDTTVTAIYNRYGYVKEMRRVLERWVNELTAEELGNLVQEEIAA